MRSKNSIFPIVLEFPRKLMRICKLVKCTDVARGQVEHNLELHNELEEIPI